ncbi:HNH endonuclease [Citrobacter braakii]|nr:HNH endonuclease [Citrobacter braakii]
MIKLNRGVPPEYLDEEKISSLTARYNETGKSVWLRKGITIPLKKTSNGKCAYCEKKVDGNGSYMEVDHYRCKDQRPDLVVQWENLVPSCKQCNTKKGKFDVDAHHIVNPYIDEPCDHFIYSSLRVVGVTDKGKETVELFGYNLKDVDSRISRMMILEKIDSELENGINYYTMYLSNGVARFLTRAKNILSGILSLCQPDSEYSAITSTLLLLNPNFIILMNHLKTYNVWDGNLDSKLTLAMENSFPVQRDEYRLVKMSNTQTEMA